MRGTTLLDLTDGWEWYARLTVPRQPSGQGRRVIYEAGLPSGPKVTIALNEGGLFFAVTDVDGQESVTTPPVPAEDLEYEVALGCLAHRTGTDELRLTVLLNGREVAATTARGAFGGRQMVAGVFGRDLQDQHPAKFTLTEVAAYGRLSQPERDQLHTYLAGRRGRAN
jgi:hypothetical protein